MSDVDDFENIRKQFEIMFQGVFGRREPPPRHNIPESLGMCGCCFRENERGHMMVIHFPHTQERIHVFVCTDCQYACSVNEVCSFSDFSKTLEKYDTPNEDKQPAER